MGGWIPKKPMTWEWFQDCVKFQDVAATFARLTTAKQLIKHVIAFPDYTVLIVSCKGTPIEPKKPKKKKDADGQTN